jgi:hypothetical protein
MIASGSERVLGLCRAAIGRSRGRGTDRCDGGLYQVAATDAFSSFIRHVAVLCVEKL